MAKPRVTDWILKPSQSFLTTNGSKGKMSRFKVTSTCAAGSMFEGQRSERSVSFLLSVNCYLIYVNLPVTNLNRTFAFDDVGQNVFWIFLSALNQFDPSFQKIETIGTYELHRISNFSAQFRVARSKLKKKSTQAKIEKKDNLNDSCYNISKTSFLQLDEAIISRAVFVIVSGSDERAGRRKRFWSQLNNGNI